MKLGSGKTHRRVAATFGFAMIGATGAWLVDSAEAAPTMLNLTDYSTVHNLTVPNGVCELEVYANGGMGAGVTGGLGGHVQAKLELAPGTPYTVAVGEDVSGGGPHSTGGVSGGMPSGGDAGQADAGGGGGASVVSVGGEPVIIAGGGGGAGGPDEGNNYPGASSGGNAGPNGASGGDYMEALNNHENSGGGGGTTSSPGLGGVGAENANGSSGSGPMGGAGGVIDDYQGYPYGSGGGGGGGFYGGGGGAANYYGYGAGGGGGSNLAPQGALANGTSNGSMGYVDIVFTDCTASSEPTNVIATPGNGTVGLTWDAPEFSGNSEITEYVITPYIVNVAQTPIHTGNSQASYQVTNLQNGTEYGFTIVAVNSAGDGNASTRVNSTPVPDAPGAPTNVTAEPGDSQVTVDWEEPNDDGGGEITGYIVTPYIDGHGQAPIDTGSTSTSYTVTELTNGTTYTFTVQAKNSTGSGAESDLSSGVIPAGPPDAPTQVSGTRGNGQVQLSWTAPFDGGTPITGYVITPYIDNIAQTEIPLQSTNTQYTVTGLINGTAYTFTVAATNAVDTGDESEPSTAVTPATTPGTATQVTATRGNAEVELSWTAPSNGGSSITSYVITPYIDNDALDPLTSSGSGTTYTAIELTNGTAYTFTITAVNAVGSGSATEHTEPVTPATTPSAPTQVTATRGNDEVELIWSAPNDGGSDITSYVITPYIDNVAQTPVGSTGTSTNYTVNDLVNGTAYTFTVAAVNALGTGQASSPTDPVTPATTPGVPTNFTATPGNSQVELSWTAPSNGGSAITGYTITPYKGGVAQTPITPSSTGTTYTVTNLVNGASYTFIVAAVNATGTGNATAPTDAVVPATTPAAPSHLSATEGDSQVELSWTAPSDGGSEITGYVITPYIDEDEQTPVTPSGTDTTYTVTDLVNGTAYTFTVAAINAIGTGPAASLTSPVTPVGPPSAPVGLTATRSGDVTTVTWSPPTSTSGLSISGYTLEYRIASGTWTTVSTDATSPATLPAVTPGTYEVRLTAHSTAGAGTPATATFVASQPPIPSINAPIMLDEDGDIVEVPAFDTGNPAQVTAGTPSGLGSWTLTPDGGVFTAGDAPFLGSMGGLSMNAPAVGLAPTPSGDGYYMVASDGGVFGFGDAAFHGSMGGQPLNAPVTAIAPSCTTDGYYLVARDGGVFAFGDVGFYGSMGGEPLNQEMVGMVDACGRNGYWTFAADGGVFAFGDAQFYGSLGSDPPANPIIAMVSAPDGLGYWLIDAARNVYGFGSVV